MSSVNVDELSNALAASTVSSSGVSFCGKALKLDTEEDAKEIVEAINNCTKLEYLNLEGNTLGVAAAKAIAKALEKHPELKRALWKDMFTGRMKSEIPLALEHLGNGLTVAGARLTEIDLSDNAFGPIGVQGLAALLRSSSCYNLQELRLNNNGLGITGGKLLASALMDCYKNSKSLGTPLALRVFIAGRNRLENDGGKALAEVFRTIGTLEEIAMPQNGIMHVGISALFDSFTHNKNLQTINLNDNTIGTKGAVAIAKALPNLQNLKQINFGDCLLKNKGAVSLANALHEKHRNLEELVLNSNEIGVTGAMALAKAMDNKNKLKTLTLRPNSMGVESRKQLDNYLKNSGQFSKLKNASESGDEDEEESEEEEESEAEEEEPESESDNEENQSINIEEKLEDFLNSPTDLTFNGLGDKKKEVLVAEGRKLLKSGIDNCMGLVMKIGGLTTSKNPEIGNQALDICKKLYEEMFGWPKQPEDISLLNNCLLTHLCLIKSEDKKFKPTWDLNGCILSLEAVINEKFFATSTKNTVKAFAARFKEEDKFCTLEKSNIMKLEAALQQV